MVLLNSPNILLYGSDAIITLGYKSYESYPHHPILSSLTIKVTSTSNLAKYLIFMHYREYSIAYSYCVY